MFRIVQHQQEVYMDDDTLVNKENGAVAQSKFEVAEKVWETEEYQNAEGVLQSNMVAMVESIFSK